jgi:hypothetical protein
MWLLVRLFVPPIVFLSDWCNRLDRPDRLNWLNSFYRFYRLDALDRFNGERITLFTQCPRHGRLLAISLLSLDNYVSSRGKGFN